jgi:hypothetical protein
MGRIKIFHPSFFVDVNDLHSFIGALESEDPSMGKGHGFEFQPLQDNKIWVLTSLSVGHKPIS